jgi:hypothetical protein
MSRARRRRSSVKLVLLLGVIAASALLSATSCTQLSSPEVEGSGTVGELRMRWAQWRADGPRSYDYEIRRTCFCVIDVVTPAQVEVRDGHVVGARALNDGRALALDLFDPIDSLFAYAIDVARRGGPVEVRYNARFGHPTFLEVGTLANDAGVRFEVGAVEPRR